LLGTGEVVFGHIALIEAELGVERLCMTRAVDGARPIAAHGVEEIPHRFGVRPLANSGKLPKAIHPRAEKVFFVVPLSGEIEFEEKTAFLFCQAVLIG